MQLLLATSNPHKLEEILSVIDTDEIEWATLDALAARTGEVFAEPVEDRDTFEGNALLKARDYARQSGWVTIADDSGLEVDALGGAPGVRSARYSGAKGARALVDAANNRRLLDELADTPAAQRTARFVCAMAIASPEARADAPGRGSDIPAFEPFVVRGTVEGRILLPDEAEDPTQPQRGRGDQGFGYDPLFVLPEDHPEFPGATTAELSAAQKNALSHRGQAARKLWETIVERGVIAG